MIKRCIVYRVIVTLFRLRGIAAAEFITSLMKIKDIFIEVILKILESNGDKIH